MKKLTKYKTFYGEVFSTEKKAIKNEEKLLEECFCYDYGTSVERDDNKDISGTSDHLDYGIDLKETIKALRKLLSEEY